MSNAKIFLARAALMAFLHALAVTESYHITGAFNLVWRPILSYTYIVALCMVSIC
jgi:hypothetical protein